MPHYRLTKIYTRTGDKGSTGLGGGQRVAKDCARIEAYGTVDELNSSLGVALTTELSPEAEALLKSIQNELFTVGGDLCVLAEDQAKFGLVRIEARHVKRLEQALDRFNAELKPLADFILPGGCASAAQLHVCRCVCRRAERRVRRLQRDEQVGAQVLPYLNRLSDLLFVLARYENLKQDVAEPLWAKGK